MLGSQQLNSSSSWKLQNWPESFVLLVTRMVQFVEINPTIFWPNFSQVFLVSTHERTNYSKLLRNGGSYLANDYIIYIYSHQPSGWMIGPVSSGLSAFVKLQAQWLFESAANSVNVWQCLKMQKHKGLAQWNIGMFHWRSTREMDSYNSTIISHHIWYPGSSKWPRLNP